jgi:uncharacterized protein YdaU (DUF1376 family)
MKDPAFLFYSSDFLTGTMFMTNEQVGLYIRMLCAQHQHGGRIDTNVLRTQCDSITGGDTVYNKFEHDEYGSYNSRLEIEMQKRREKADKARASVNKRWEKRTQYDSNTNVLRSESENENVIEDKKEKKGGAGGKKRKQVEFVAPTMQEVIQYFQDNGYSKDAAERAFLYYDSRQWHNRDNKKVEVWKTTMVNNWFKPENKEQKIVTRYQTYNPDIHK